MNLAMNLESVTPTKSVITTRVKGKNITQKIAYINKKGTFKLRDQCKECTNCGKVQVGLYMSMDYSCDRDEESWRIRSGSTERECKYFKPKESTKA